ncbi:hypothetical protein TRFO_02862 [Tritrichomonas foetus]|uniref:Uncharacterized protein n=1 Tax=Tritrichomonas foetus TaxID=1144522 RepID=A0A1J4KWB6_9EUKA|nr:hypothetical protein TRFO_02862 [Tritrichomonas foetus]|eukprot:OHT15531.1 hypothetical protein TRFO_02862 [Tritrichomonas foetus]
MKGKSKSKSKTKANNNTTKEDVFTKRYNKPKWDNFSQLVTEYIKEHSIASMAEVFDISTKAFTRSVWTTPKLEEMAHYLVTYSGCFRIDLTVNYPKPLPIYPGHHKLSSTTFFVLDEGSEDHFDDVEKAKAILEELTKSAIQRVEELRKNKNKRQKDRQSTRKQSENIEEEIQEEPVKTKPKKSKKNLTIEQMFNLEKETEQENDFDKSDFDKKDIDANDIDTNDIDPSDIDPNDFYDENGDDNLEDRFLTRDGYLFGYTSNRKLQYQMLHTYIFETFQYNPFTIEELVNSMPVDFYLKFVMIKELPQIFLQEPRLRHILVRCFPESFREGFCFSSAHEVFQKLIMTAYREKGYQQEYALFTRPTEDTFQLIDSIQLEVFDQFTFHYIFYDSEQILLFHEMLKEIELLENIDPHSINLWLKRYSLHRKARNGETHLTRAIVTQTVSEPFIETFPFSYPRVEKFIIQHGQNWINLQASLLRIYSKNVKQVKECLYPTTGPVAEFCEGNADFQPYPALYFDFKDLSDFEFLRNVDKNVVFNYLSAVMQITMNGLITNLQRPWSKAMQFFTELTGTEREEFLHHSMPQNLNMFLNKTYRDYYDLNNYTTVYQSVQNHAFNQEQVDLEKTFEITTTAYFQRFHLNYIRFQMSPTISELVERLKMISLTPKDVFSLKDAKRMLTEIDCSQMEEAVFYLKISRFMNQPVVYDEPDRTSRFQCTRRTITDFNITRPFSMYENIMRYVKISRNPNNVEAAAESNSGAVTYLLEPDAPLTIVLEPTKASTIDHTAVLMKLSKSSMTVSSKKSRNVDAFSVKMRMIGVPLLPHFDVQVPTPEYTVKPIADFRTYEGDNCQTMQEAFMELLVLICQTRSEKDPQLLVLMTRLIYAYILNRKSRGASLDKIIMTFNAYELVNVFIILSILEQFDFVYRLNITSAMPIFFADKYAGNHYIRCKMGLNQYKLVKPHIWISSDGSTEENMLQKLRMKAAEIIDSNPGIEFLEISNKMPALSIYDLYQILDALELDEIVFSKFVIEQDGDLFVDDSVLLSPYVDCVMFFYNMTMSQKDPNVNPLRRYFYPSPKLNINLALSVI